VAEGLDEGLAQAAAEGAQRLDHPIRPVMGGVDVLDAHAAAGGGRGNGFQKDAVHRQGE
jgi:hypothetical protein